MLVFSLLSSILCYYQENVNDPESNANSPIDTPSWWLTLGSGKPYWMQTLSEQTVMREQLRRNTILTDLILLAFKSHPGLPSITDPAVPGKEFFAFTYAEVIETIAICVLLDNLSLRDEPPLQIVVDDGRKLGKTQQCSWCMQYCATILWCH